MMGRSEWPLSPSLPTSDSLRLQRPLSGTAEGSAAINTPAVRTPLWALWGDSQAEGVCVSDDEKLWAAIVQQWDAARSTTGDPRGNARRLSERIDVLPFAASGDDGWDWCEQLAPVEQAWGVQGHLILIAELADLRVLADSARRRPRTDESVPVETAGTRRSWLRFAPNFVVHAARGLLLDGQSQELRRLRFRPGPLTVSPSAAEQPPFPPSSVERDSGAPTTADAAERWQAIAGRLRRQSDQPILLIYAPLRPLVVDGHVLWDRPEPIDPAWIQILRDHDIGWIDCYDALVEMARSGDFPHGFHNGRIGNGHLNAAGYRVIARHICESIARGTPSLPDQQAGPDQQVGPDRQTRQDRQAAQDRRAAL